MSVQLPCVETSVMVVVVGVGLAAGHTLSLYSRCVHVCVRWRVVALVEEEEEEEEEEGEEEKGEGGE